MLDKNQKSSSISGSSEGVTPLSITTSSARRAEINEKLLKISRFSRVAHSNSKLDSAKSLGRLNLKNISLILLTYAAFVHFPLQTKKKPVNLAFICANAPKSLTK
jgi:hypothetical protein